MGREVRKVPPNFEHPKQRDGSYIPLNDGFNYEELAGEWIINNELWVKGEHEDQINKVCNYEKYYFNWETPPIKEEYTDINKEDCTWFQVYETVSEGTPCTPPFETQDQLIEYLVEKGEFNHQKHPDWEHCQKPSRESAEKFVKCGGWAPSFVFSNGRVYNSIDSVNI